MQHEDLERNFGFLLHDVSRLMRTAYDRKVRSLGLTRSQWWVLTHLYRNAGATQSELAAVLEIEKASLGRMLDRLEANGWIRREADSADRRVRRVFLTETFGPSMRQLRAAAADLRAETLVGISNDQIDAFIDMLHCMKTNLAQLSAEDTGANGTGAPTAPVAANDPARTGVQVESLDSQTAQAAPTEQDATSSDTTLGASKLDTSQLEANEHTVV